MQLIKVILQEMQVKPFFRLLYLKMFNLKAIAKKITSVSGASNVFKMGFCTYSNHAKHKLLGVKKKTLKKFTAVSEQTAK